MKVEKIRQLIEFMEQHNLQELEIKGLFYHVKLKKQTPFNGQFQVAPSVNTATQETVQSVPSVQKEVQKETKSEKEYHKILSPMVGTFYRSPSPGAEPFVKEGDIVKKGQVVCIIEAMKVMNEIESDVSGRIVKVLVENGSPVEYHQPLFLVDTEAA